MLHQFFFYKMKREVISERKTDIQPYKQPLPTAAMAPGDNLASRTQRPLQYAASTVSSAVRLPSAYAQPNSPTECPMIPSGSRPTFFKQSTNAT